MAGEWSAHDDLYLDDRVVFLAAPPMLERALRNAASDDQTPSQRKGESAQPAADLPPDVCNLSRRFNNWLD